MHVRDGSLGDMSAVVTCDGVCNTCGYCACGCCACGCCACDCGCCACDCGC